MSGSADMDSDSDSSDSNATAVVLGIVLVLDIITVVLRFYARKITKVGVKWDDWLILAAIVATLVVAGLLIWCMVHLLSLSYSLPWRINGGLVP